MQASYMGDHITEVPPVLVKQPVDGSASYCVKYTLKGHAKAITSVQFSPDGQWLASGSGDKTIKVWSATSGLFQCTLIGHSAGINDITWSTDSRYLASCSDDFTARIWGIIDNQIENTVCNGNITKASPQCIDEINEPVFVESSLDSSSNVVVGTEATTTVVDSQIPQTSTIGVINPINRHHHTFTTTITTTAIATKTSAQLLQCGGIELRTLRGHTAHVFCVAFNPRGNLLITGSFDETIRVWDTRQGTCLRTVAAHSDPVTAVQFSPDGTLIVSSSYDGLVRLWDAHSGMCLRTLVSPSDIPRVGCVRFSPNGRFVLASNIDSSIVLWDIHQSVAVRHYTGHKNSRFCLIPAWVVAETTKDVCTEEDEEVNSKDESHQQSKIEHKSEQNGGEKSNLLENLKIKPRKKISSPLSSMDDSPFGSVVDARIVVGSEDARIYIWDVQTATLLAALEGHVDTVIAVDYCAKHNIIASGATDLDRTIKIWSLENKKPSILNSNPQIGSLDETSDMVVIIPQEDSNQSLQSTLVPPPPPPLPSSCSSSLNTRSPLADVISTKNEN